MRLLFVALLFAFSTAAFSFQNEEKLADAGQEARAMELFSEIRCLVCKGESLAESNAELAVDMRGLIRDKVAGGESNQEIREFLVFRYGEAILQKPPFKPSTYLLWLMPVGLLVFGAMIIINKTKLPKDKKNGRRRVK